SIDGNLLVWMDDRNGDYDIFGYDLLTQTEFAIATGLGDQLRPAISGNIVVWEMNGDIYGTTIPEPCSLFLIGLGGLLLRKRK
ncbi:MAG: PEP-CTERM sorting domain-containing protein, partial [Sedimentisphaerales bacterium]